MLYRFIYLLVLFVFLVSSCDNFLSPETPSQVTQSQFWNNPNEAELGVAGIYDEVQTVFEQNYFEWGELRADNYIYNDRPRTIVERMIDNELTLNTGGADWSSLYTAIATANTAIRNIPDIPAFDRQDDLLAQAHTLRALLYFYAVRVWGDVPKVTEPSNLDQELNKPRSPVSEIYTDIILDDLQQAEQLISTEQSLNNISLGSILALKAHVYMWPGNHQDYTTARDAITQLESLGYSLETTQDAWVSIFRGPGNTVGDESSSEIIFSLAFDVNEDGGNNGIGQFSSATPDLIPAPRLDQKWQATVPKDFRRLETAAFDVEIVSESEFPLFRILKKYSGEFNDRDLQGSWASFNAPDIRFYRLSGLLLLKAEAENYLNNSAKALALINRVRTARGLPLVDETIIDQQQIREMILNERQFELMGEGHRYWDLVRNKVVLDVMKPINGMNDPNRIFWPISQNVLDRNPNIEQNEGY